jgi:hypothetical protein
MAHAVPRKLSMTGRCGVPSTNLLVDGSGNTRVLTDYLQNVSTTPVESRGFTRTPVND